MPHASSASKYFHIECKVIQRKFLPIVTSITLDDTDIYMFVLCLYYVWQIMLSKNLQIHLKNTKHGCKMLKMSQYLSIPFQCPNILNMTFGITMPPRQSAVQVFWSPRAVLLFEKWRSANDFVPPYTSFSTICNFLPNHGRVDGEEKKTDSCLAQ